MTKMFDIESMRDDNGLYPDDIAAILSAGDPEELKLLRKVGRMRVEHSKYTAAWEWLQHMYDHHGGENPVSLEGVSGLFYGPSGAGKSTVLRLFTKQLGGPFPTRSGDIRPVIRAATPANPTTANIYGAVLIALGMDEFVSNNAQDMRRIIYVQLKAQQTRLIIFDEFTHVIEDRSQYFTTKTMRVLKELLNEIHCNVVFAGTDELVKLYEIYPQMRRRDNGGHPMTGFSWEDQRDQDEWYDLMEIIQEEMLLKVKPALDEERMGRLMHQASAGVMDHLMKLLFRATSFAFREKAKTISMDHLARSFEQLRRGDQKAANPFGEASVRRAKPKIVDEDAEEEVSNLSKRKNLRDGRDSFTK